MPYGKLGGIDAFNKWKKRAMAESPEEYGWLGELYQLVLEEASKDAGEALDARRHAFEDRRRPDGLGDELPPGALRIPFGQWIR